MKKNGLTIALLSLLASACAYQKPSVIALPPPPKPQVAKEAMMPLPEPLYFQNKLNEIFDSSWQKPTP